MSIRRLLIISISLLLSVTSCSRDESKKSPEEIVLEWIHITQEADYENWDKNDESVLQESSIIPGTYEIKNDGKDSPDVWIEKNAKKEYEMYKSLYSIQVRDVDEYTSAESMLFWDSEIQDLYENGFKEEFVVKPFAKAKDDNEYIIVFPLLNGKEMDEGIVLISEDGKWKIFSLFNNPNYTF